MKLMYIKNEINVYQKWIKVIFSLHEHKKKNWLSSLYFLFEYLNISKSSISNDKLASVAKSKLIKDIRLNG